MPISLQADATLPQGYVLVDGQRVLSVSTTDGLSATGINGTLANNIVTPQSISSNAVTTNAIADNAVTFAKLATNAKILAYDSLRNTAEILTTTFTINQPGLLIVSGYCQGNYSGSLSNAGNYAFVYLNSPTYAAGGLLVSDGMFEGESVTVGFYSNAVGLTAIPAGTHRLDLLHTITPSTLVRQRTQLQYIVLPF